MSREILLTQGLVAIVDDEDYDWLTQWKWCAAKSGTSKQFYAKRAFKRNGKQHYILMHRAIMNAPVDKIVDHKDRNSLNNCRNNLRICDKSLNAANALAHVDTKGKYKGVRPTHWGWSARIRRLDNNYNLGYFPTAEEAAIAYNQAAIELFGEFACLNTM